MEFLLLKGLRTPLEIHEFCVKNSKFCENNKSLICKKILQTAGYKVPKEYDIFYCNIYKEMTNLVKRVETKNKIKKIESDMYLYFDKKLYEPCETYCSSLLISFLYANGIKINKKRSRSSYSFVKSISPQSRDTVKDF